jgi:5'(3')-deoxyribonucleotidase
MRLGIDLDGVVADFDGGWMSRYHEEFGSDPRLSHAEPGAPQMVWDGLHHGTHFPDMDAFWDWVHSHHLFRHLDPLPGALEGLSKLANDGHEIVILTAKPDRAVPDTLHWLADLQLPTREIHFIHAKHRVVCDAYLDDSPLVLPDLVAHHPTALVCRMVAPWNEPVAGAVDVVDWSEFLSVVGQRSQVV